MWFRFAQVFVKRFLCNPFQDEERLWYGFGGVPEILLELKIRPCILIESDPPFCLVGIVTYLYLLHMGNFLRQVQSN
jgi:hypothetical protein